MKQGKSIEQLSAELIRIRDNSKDFIAPVNHILMTDTAKLSMGDKPLVVNNWAHGQISDYTNIPKAYYDRLKEEAPALLSRNVNHGLSVIEANAKQSRKSEARLIRTVDGTVRGFLSNRFRRLDSHDLIEAVMPTLMDNGFRVVSSEITERRLYLKVLTDKVQGEVKVNDTVQFGMVISNSDVGGGSLRVEPLLYRLACANGMITNNALRSYHVGKKLGEGSDIEELLSDRTKELEDDAFWAKVQDVVKNSMRKDIFKKELDRLKLAANIPILDLDLPRVVELTTRKLGFTQDGVKKSILHALANGNEGAGLTQWGLANAVTRAAQSPSIDYDLATELERAGGRIIELAPKDWAAISATGIDQAVIQTSLLAS